jgi:hypothetical protein
VKSDATVLPRATVWALENAARCVDAAFRNPCDAHMYAALAKLHCEMASEALACREFTAAASPPASTPRAVRPIELSRTLRDRDHARRFTDSDLRALTDLGSAADAAE